MKYQIEAMLQEWEDALALEKPSDKLGKDGRIIEKEIRRKIKIGRRMLKLCNKLFETNESIYEQILTTILK